MRSEGLNVLQMFSTEYVLAKYPQLPTDAAQSVIRTLTNTATLSNVGKQLGIPYVMKWKVTFNSNPVT